MDTTPPNDKLVEAAEAFPQPSAPQLPEITAQDLIDLGISITETETSRSIEIPFEAQKKLMTVVQGYGFGSSQAFNVLLQRILSVAGLSGTVQCRTDEKTYAWFGKVDLGAKKETAAPVETPATSSPSGDEAVIAERGKVYGDPELSHQNIGLSWTGLLQQHYQLRLPYPLPAWLVELMMVSFKIHRASRVFHEDNFVDARCYGKFAEEHQRAAFQGKPAA